MKTIILFLLLTFPLIGISQMQTNVGIGYFGHTITHPGIVLEYELEQKFNESTSLPLRIDFGFYVHNRNHNGLFIDVNYGLRKIYKNGLMLEESIGIGILETMLNGDGVYEVDDAGNVSETNTWNEPDFMPGITLGIGYNLTNNSERMNLIWIRPKLYWQIPHKFSSTFHPAVQIGFSRSLK